MPKKKGRISDAVIRRMPKYYRYLQDMESKGVKRISSSELSRRMGLTASQIRQDFNCFGGFGQQGYGYNITELKHEIKKILGINKSYNLIAVGAGNFGQALANYNGFEREDFFIRALFDVNPRLIGMSIRGIPVLDIDDLKDFTSNNKIDIGVVCTPKESAQEIAEVLVECGIRAIWNFAPVYVSVPDDVLVENVHLTDSLYTLSYRIDEKNSGVEE